MSSPEIAVEEPSTRGPQHTRDRILDEAEALFAHKGFAGTSVRDIANRAGLTPASLYNHFSNKDALYRAVLERGVQPLIERLGDLASSEDIDVVGPIVIEGIMAHLAEHSHLPRLIALEAATGGEHLNELSRNWIRPLTDQAIAAFKDESKSGASGWSVEEAPLAISAWMQMIFGHFSMAPLLHEVLGRDPLSKECLEEQTRFLIKLARVMSISGKSIGPE